MKKAVKPKMFSWEGARRKLVLAVNAEVKEWKDAEKAGDNNYVITRMNRALALVDFGRRAGLISEDEAWEAKNEKEIQL